jgi:DNA polymerase I-like protein with 3'-5' exonuclease and polymerase domains
LETPTAGQQMQQGVVAALEATPAGFTVPLKVNIKTGRTWADCK